MGPELLNRVLSRLLPQAGAKSLYWHPARILDQGRTGSAALAVGRRGQGIVLWENDGHIWGLDLSGDDALASYPMGPGGAPQLTVNEKGQGAALWLQEADGTVCLQASPISPGRLEAQTRTIFQTNGRIHQLQLGVDRRGGAMALWAHECQKAWQICVQSFNPRKGTWDEEAFHLGPEAPLPLEFSFAMSRRGQAMVLLRTPTEDGEGLGVYHYWSPDRIWSDHPVPVAARRGDDLKLPMDREGNALALWVFRNRGQGDLLESAYYRAATGDWDGPHSLAHGATISQPRLVMSPDGQTLALWHQHEEGGATSVFARQGSRGEWASRPQRLDADGEHVRGCALVPGAGGQAGLLLIRGGARGESIIFRTWDGTWGEPALLCQGSDAVHSRPALAMGADSAVAAWCSGQGDGTRLFLCRGH